MNAPGKGNMGTDVSWHLPEQYVAAYVTGHLTDPEAWSLETHVSGCAGCADRVGEAVRATQLAPQVAGIKEAVRSQTEAEAAERSRARAETPSRGRTWRLLTAAPALWLPWVMAIVLVMAGAACLSILDSVAFVHHPVLLLAGPLLPLAGVAISYGPGRDPAYEITLATPFSGFRLLLLRTVTVLAAAIPLLLGAGLVAGPAGVSAAAWLLPSIAMVGVALALGSFVGQLPAAWLVGAMWAIGVAGPALIERAIHADLEAFPALVAWYGPAAQAGWLAVAVLAAAVLVARRDSYERVEG